MKFFTVTALFSLLGATMAAPAPAPAAGNSLTRRVEIDGVLACTDPIVHLVLEQIKALPQTRIDKLLADLLSGQELKNILELDAEITEGVTELIACLSIGIGDVDAQIGDVLMDLLKDLHLIPADK
ncbi:hypothetical protein FQN55_009360 [Onygenales sp. PD_40]|nr:hypothetical protein FQN55_009360 [Onygenales sp. PD_40]KAK2781505.1 hypothetical protein FQN53_000521 [Emmonsiellopsis sp. PD_33]KAK2782313.1 hypothetical protein FQN52_000958 [Onygenales sp. PD_12]KAK2798964.1 hypothetical protein FQN51_007192 [Onygenales sp. PD_10]